MNYKEKYTLDSKEAAVDNIVLTKKLWADKEIICRNVSDRSYFRDCGEAVIRYDKIILKGNTYSEVVDEYTLFDATGFYNSKKRSFSISIEYPIRLTFFLFDYLEFIDCLKFLNYCNQCRINNIRTYFIKYEKYADEELKDQNMYDISAKYLFYMTERYGERFGNNPFDSSYEYRAFSYKCLTSIKAFSNSVEINNPKKYKIFNFANAYEIETCWDLGTFDNFHNKEFILVLQKKYDISEIEANIFSFFLLTKCLISMLNEKCILTSIIDKSNIKINDYSVEDITGPRPTTHHPTQPTPNKVN